MNYQTNAAKSLSTPDLLAMLVGQKKAAAFSQTPLSVLFGMRAERQTTAVCENQPQYTPTAILS
ncbi:MAG: RadC family protein, partial [Gallionella sp.]